MTEPRAILARPEPRGTTALRGVGLSLQHFLMWWESVFEHPERLGYVYAEGTNVSYKEYYDVPYDRLYDGVEWDAFIEFNQSYYLETSSSSTAAPTAIMRPREPIPSGDSSGVVA